MKIFNNIKTLASKFRFFFRFKISILDLDKAKRKQLIELCQRAKISPLTIVFKRTFNNIAWGEGFDFIGIFPVFACRELAYCYFSENNEID